MLCIYVWALLHTSSDSHLRGTIKKKGEANITSQCSHLPELQVPQSKLLVSSTHKRGGYLRQLNNRSCAAWGLKICLINCFYKDKEKSGQANIGIIQNHCQISGVFLLSGGLDFLNSSWGLGSWGENEGAQLLLLSLN